MHYDPVKDRLENIINRLPLFRRMLFWILRNVFLREMEVRRRLRLLKKAGFKPGRILDAGTGLGQYALYLRQLFPEAEILSVDIKQAYLDNMDQFCMAENLKGIQFKLQDLLELDHIKQYDLILNVDVMEHIEDDQLVFDNFRKALKDDGLLVLHTPAVPESWSMQRVEFEAGSYSVGEHVREGYKHSMMRERLCKSGFSGVDVTSTYGFWGGLAWKLMVRAPMVALNSSFLLAPFVLLWMLLMFIPARLFNVVEVLSSRSYGGCMQVTAAAGPKGLKYLRKGSTC